MHLAGAHVAGLDQVGEHIVGARARGRQVDVRGKARGRLEQAGDQRGLRQVDVAHRLGEVELGGGLHAEGAAAEIGAVEIELQDLALGEARFEQEGEEHLLELARERALRGQEQVLGQLLADGRAALHHLVGARVLEQRAGGADEVDAEMLEEAAILGGERGLDEVIGDLLERHRVVVQDAALADLGAVAVEEFHGELAGVDLVLVELVDRGDGQDEEHDETAGAHRQRLADGLVEEVLPARQPEAGKEAGDGVPALLHGLPALGERGVDPGVDAQPIDQPPARTMPEEPVVQGKSSFRLFFCATHPRSPRRRPPGRPQRESRR